MNAQCCGCDRSHRHQPAKGNATSKHDCTPFHTSLSCLKFWLPGLQRATNGGITNDMPYECTCHSIKIQFAVLLPLLQRVHTMSRWCNSHATVHGEMHWTQVDKRVYPLHKFSQLTARLVIYGWWANTCNIFLAHFWSVHVKQLICLQLVCSLFWSCWKKTTWHFQVLPKFTNIVIRDLNFITLPSPRRGTFLELRKNYLFIFSSRDFHTDRARQTLIIIYRA